MLIMAYCERMAYYEEIIRDIMLIMAYYEII